MFVSGILTEFVVFEESGSNIRSKHDAHTTLRGVSSIHVARVRPEALNHDALIAWLPLAVSFGDLAQLDAILREEATVAHHHLLVNHVTQGQVTEEL